jgi:hypothetical protein
MLSPMLEVQAKARHRFGPPWSSPHQWRGAMSVRRLAMFCCIGVELLSNDEGGREAKYTGAAAATLGPNRQVQP